jgi:enoyl-CoA hydratase
MKYLTITEEKNIAIVRFKRHEALNAINLQVMDELGEIPDEISDHIKICVFEPVSSESGVAMSGGDLKEFHRLQTEEEADEMSAKMTSNMQKWEERDWLTIGIFDGKLFGGGCEWALIFDQRWISTATSFGFSQLRFGLPPGWGGFTRLAHLTNTSFALNCYLRKKTLDAHDAQQHLLADEVFEAEQFDQQVKYHLNTLQEIAPDALSALISALHRSKNKEFYRLIEQERPEFAKAWASDEHHKRVDEFKNQKK